MRSWFLLILVLYSSPAFSEHSATIGYSAIEQGDDRYLGGLSGQVLLGEYYVRGHFQRRKFLPVSLQTYSVALGKRAPLFGLSELQLGYGVVGLLERTSIQYTKEKDKAFNRNENQFNIGLALGVFWEKSFATHFHYTVGWEAYLFPAGIAAIFLTTGRKQYLSAGVGVEW